MVEHTCHHHDDATCVSLVPIFNHLDAHQMAEIHALTKSVVVRKGEHLYQAGDPSNALYIVSEGRVRIYRLAESGKEQLLRLLNPGDFTGELALFTASVHESYACAMTETHICTITRDDLQALMIKYPAIAMKILAVFSQRLDESEKQTTRFATENVERRLALFLVESMDPPGNSGEITLPMSRKDLASYLGTTPETLSRRLMEFEDKGLIQQRTSKRIRILDADQLLLIA